MNKTFFSILTFFSKIPLRISYRLSPFLYFVLFKVVKYRKQIVFTSLRNSFPEKSEAEIQEIARGFYRNFADYFIETVRSISIPMKEMQNRWQIENLEIFQKPFDEKKNVGILMAHNFNFEWSSASGPLLPQKNIVPVYKKMSDQYLDDKVNELRTRFGAIPLEAKDAYDGILNFPQDGNSTFLLISDQSPKASKSDLFIDFLNQKTLVFRGFEKLCLRADLAVFFADIKKVKQGHYVVHAVPIEPDGDTFEPQEITLKFFKLLEENIKRDPSNWLWSHKRWKNHPKNISN